MNRYLIRLVSLVSLFALVMSLAQVRRNAQAIQPHQGADAAQLAPAQLAETADSTAPEASHRLIVELSSAPLAAWGSLHRNALHSNGRLNMKSAAAQAYLAQLEAEQAQFVAAMLAAVPGATVGTFRNELGALEQASYRVVFNGLTVDPGQQNRDDVRKQLQQIPGVKHVYLDFAHQPDLYASNNLIKTPRLWSNPAIGGRGNAGTGVKLASMDGGVHKDAPMFNGTGYSYPTGYPANGIGLTQNNNGKIIASRAYFRTWDPPSAGDENPWPGTQGTSHGVHTAGIAGGNVVDGSIDGLAVPGMSGVAPRAWIMSYRVFYNSVTNNGSFYNAEGIAALEDIAGDGADVVNNSWGGGPGSAGGEYDALDTALRNAAAAGVFVSMSAGNSGPGNGTTDHPSEEYINVAATTTDGTFASGRLNVTQPTPISPTLQSMGFASASFGAPLPVGTTISHPYLPASAVNTANVEGCSAFPAGTFNGKAALIRRGGCEFGVKAVNAQNAGATFVVVYNNTGGTTLINMGAGAVGNQFTGRAISVGQNNGNAMVNWYNIHGAASTLELNTVAYQAGNTPDRVANFSSRGPGVGNVLKPDIAAPGVNILSQGYTTGATGENRHLGYGQVSGTSMAAPHVAGAAALLRQAHPSWSNAYIKSALMSTSKYLNIFNENGTPAQPLDMGAGRMDLERASDPGVILDPPSLSYGLVVTGTAQTLQVRVTNITNATETYNLSTLYTGGGFTNMPRLPGFTVSPSSLTLAPGASVAVTVSFNPAAGRGYGDNQGYIVLDGATHDAHMPAWARVTYATTTADVLVIDNDGSSSLGGAQYPNYTRYYTETLQELGYSYHVLNVDASVGTQGVTSFLPSATELYRYKAILYFSGNNRFANGAFTVPSPLTALDMNRLTEYANNGGFVMAMGQDAAAVMASNNASPTFFYGTVLGGQWLRNSVTNSTAPLTLTVQPITTAPLAFQNLQIDLGATGDGAKNQTSVDEIDAQPNVSPDNPELELPYVPLLRYPTPTALENGTVAMAHREQPSLERPGVTYPGGSIYTSFGLEGVNNLPNRTSRMDLLKTFLNWGFDKPTATINTSGRNQNQLTFSAQLTSPIPSATAVSYRWDFGDGSAYTAPSASNQVSHSYAALGTYTVRVEVTDSLGNTAIDEFTVEVQSTTYLPFIAR